MKKIVCLLFFVTVSFYSQEEIFKGLKYGMNENESKKEFQKNKPEYINIDFGNNFYYRIFRQNFVFIDNKLSSVLLSPKGFALGMDYDSAKNYLIHTRNYFKELNYQTFIDNEFWNAPYNYVKSGSKWGLVMYNQEKTKIIQIYTVEFNVTQSSSYIVYLKVWNYKKWMELYEKETQIQHSKKKNSGF